MRFKTHCVEVLGAPARPDARVYFTVGVSAVLIGWRPATIDIDLSIVPVRDDLLRAIPESKGSLNINVELVAPSHFIPELPGWKDRSLFVAREGPIRYRIGRFLPPVSSHFAPR